MPISGGKYVAPTWVNGSSPAIDASEMQAITDTLELLGLENGGTGVTSLAELKQLLSIGAAAALSLPISVENGGTGVTSVAALKTLLTLGTAAAVSVPITIANGGTGATDAAGARAALGLGNVALLNAPVPITSGGTGATTAQSARTALGVPTITSGTAAPTGGADGDIYIQYSAT